MSWLFVMSALFAHDISPGVVSLREVEPRVYRFRLVAGSDGSGVTIPLRVGWPDGCDAVGDRLICANHSDGEVRITNRHRRSMRIVWRVETLSGPVMTGVVGSKNQSFSLWDWADADWYEEGKDSFLLGLSHVLKGLDHVLFVLMLGLLYPFGLRLFKALVGFTLGHSLTLGITALGLVAPPMASVEILIALTLVLMARGLVVADSFLSQRSPVLISLLLGLLHGFGFAGGLSLSGLDLQTSLWFLATFNLGVEAAQLVVLSVLVAGVTFGVPRRVVNTLALRRIAAYPIGGLAVYWCLSRTVGWWETLSV